MGELPTALYTCTVCWSWNWKALFSPAIDTAYALPLLGLVMVAVDGIWSSVPVPSPCNSDSRPCVAWVKVFFSSCACTLKRPRFAPSVEMRARNEISQVE